MKFSVGGEPVLLVMGRQIIRMMNVKKKNYINCVETEVLCSILALGIVYRKGTEFLSLMCFMEAHRFTSRLEDPNLTFLTDVAVCKMSGSAFVFTHHVTSRL